MSGISQVLSQHSDQNVCAASRTCSCSDTSQDGRTGGRTDGCVLQSGRAQLKSSSLCLEQSGGAQMGPAENVWTAFKTKQNVFWVGPLGCQHRLSVPGGSRLFVSRDRRQSPSTDQIPRRGKVRGSVPHPHGLAEGEKDI